MVKLNNFNFVTSLGKSNNYISTSKYTLLNFIPKAFCAHFSKFINLLSLLLAITQFFEELKVGFLGSFIAPCLMATLISFAKELLEDLDR